MKASRILRIEVLACSALFCLAAWNPLRADPVPTPATTDQNTAMQTPAPPPPLPTPAPPPSDPAAAPVTLPYGVDEVLKLVRAQISEPIIINYVQNSGTVYNLPPDAIVYLKNQGVPDRVITVMLDQRNRVAAQANAQVAAQQAAAAAAAANQQAIPYPTSPAPEPTYAPAPGTDTQPAPSTAYVIPNSPSTYPYYSYYNGSPYYNPYGYPYYGYPYYGYGGPVVSFGFGYYGGYRGGYHGGYYGGYHGGYRGGGGHVGHH